MRIKRIEAESIAEAMRLLRRELGDNALVLHTRSLAPRGVAGWFRAPRVEILGAVDEPHLLAPGAAEASRRAAPPGPAPSSTFARMQSAALAAVQSSLTLPAAPGAAGAAPVAQTPARPEAPAAPAGEPAARLKKGRRAPRTAAAGPARAALEPLAGVVFGRTEWGRTGRRGRRIAFVGPTGAGKTTTLAKLAARAQLEHGQRVGLVTIDTYRIGAVPQLGAYADILRVPLEVAHTPEELSHALARLHDRDVVFIDTIGRSPLGGGVDGLVPFLATAAADEVHLVLAATTRAEDSLRAARSFARLVPNRLVITKIDETEDYGALAAVSRATGLPLTWLGVGQEVPDDLEEATPERLAALLGAGCPA